MPDTNMNYEDVFRIFAKPNEVIEVRAIGLPAKPQGPWNGFARNGIVSGYFDDPQKFAKAVNALENCQRAMGIYLTMNPVNPTLLARANNRLKVLDATTQDKQVACQRWLLIDTDPKRPSGISASNEELQGAIKLRNDVVEWLGNNGFPSPLKAMSGNGGHADYRLEDLPNTEEITNLKRDALKALNHRFGRNGIDIDEAVFNPSRIMKLYGTTARKGDDIPERPHRKSYIEEIPDSIKPVTLEQLKWLAAQKPEDKRETTQTRAARDNGSLGPVDVGRYLDHYGVSYKIKQEANRTVYGLDVCLFDSDHTHNDASIIQANDGRLYYQCFHNGCKSAGYRWQDARQKISGEDKIARFCEGYKPTRRKTPKRKTSTTTEGFHLTDMGNAERFAEQHVAKVRYCHPWGAWFIYNGKRWKRDSAGTIKRKAKTTVRQIYKEASAIVDDKEREKVVSHAKRSETRSRIEAMVELAASEPGIPIEPDDLDQQPMLLNCLNGTLDLTTGTLRPHTTDDLITKIAPVKFDLGAMCPGWELFLNKVLAGNKDLIGYVKRVVGYCLTGSTTEHALFFLYGTGANGKTTFLETIKGLLGDYSRQVDFSTFLLQKHESVRNDLAMLKGARAVSAVEVDAGKRLAEVMVKTLTGGDTIAARFLYHEYFEYKPEFKILLAANHKPLIYGTDHAIWRRIRLIPFTVTIPENEQDPELVETLKLEWPGILNWAIEGCLEWQGQRLGISEAVREATNDYRNEMDILGPFIEFRCEIGPRKRVFGPELYDQYGNWCEQEKEDAVSKRTFTLRLKERGFISKRATGGRANEWLGIGLKTEASVS